MASQLYGMERVNAQNCVTSFMDSNTVSDNIYHVEFISQLFDSFGGLSTLHNLDFISRFRLSGKIRLLGQVLFQLNFGLAKVKQFSGRLFQLCSGENIRTQ